MFHHGVRLDAEIVELPLSRRGRDIAGGFHQLGNARVFVGVKISATPSWAVPVIDPAVAERILPGQEASARGRALRHGVGVVVLGACCGELIDVGGLDVFSAVAVDPLFAQIIEKDENDVRFFQYRARMRWLRSHDDREGC